MPLITWNNSQCEILPIENLNKTITTICSMAKLAEGIRALQCKLLPDQSFYQELDQWIISCQELLSETSKLYLYDETWEEMRRRYLYKYFSPSDIASILSETVIKIDEDNDEDDDDEDEDEDEDENSSEMNSELSGEYSNILVISDNDTIRHKKVNKVYNEMINEIKVRINCWNKYDNLISTLETLIRNNCRIIRKICHDHAMHELEQYYQQIYAEVARIVNSRRVSCKRGRMPDNLDISYIYSYSFSKWLIHYLYVECLVNLVGSLD